MNTVYMNNIYEYGIYIYECCVYIHKFITASWACWIHYVIRNAISGPAARVRVWKWRFISSCFTYGKENKSFGLTSFIVHRILEFYKSQCKLHFRIFFIEGSSGAGAKRDELWLRFPIEEIFNIFIFWLCCGVKSGVKFRHSSHNTSKIRRKMGGRNVLTLGSISLPFYIRDTPWRNYYIF